MTKKRRFTFVRVTMIEDVTDAPSLIDYLREKSQPVTNPTVSVKITPEDARLILSHSNKCNRAMKLNAVRQYASDMREGRWIGNIGDAITIDLDGLLIDGQNRMQAVVLYGQPVVFEVKFGVSKEAKFVKDTGVKRTAADIMRMEEVPNDSAVAATLRAIAAYDTNRPGIRLTNVQTKKLYQKYPEVVQSAAIVKKKPVGGSQQFVAALHFIVSRQGERNIADRFVQSLQDYPDAYPGDAAKQLRIVFEKAKQDGLWSKHSASMVEIPRVWNLFREKKKYTAATYVFEVHIHGFKRGTLLKGIF